MTRVLCFHGKTYCALCKVGRRRRVKNRAGFTEGEKAKRTPPRRCAACSRRLKKGEPDVCTNCRAAGFSVEPLMKRDAS